MASPTLDDKENAADRNYMEWRQYSLIKQMETAEAVK
jgi:hypothetical protein